MLMRKWILLLLVFSFLLCSCSRKESDINLEFPGTSWGMGMREVQDVLDLDEKDIGYTYVSDACMSSMFHMEGYELFGAKTKSVDFQFLDLDPIRQKKEEQKEELKGHELFGKKQYGRNDQLLDLIRDHELTEVLVDYPADTDMEQVLEKMRERYGKTIPHIVLYEMDPSSTDFAPAEYQDSEQVKIWGTDVVAALIPEKKSEAYYDQWKFYEKAIDRAGWDTFSKNAYMQSVLCLNEKDRKSLLFFGFHAGIYRTLQEQIR